MVASKPLPAPLLATTGGLSPAVAEAVASESHGNAILGEPNFDTAINRPLFSLEPAVKI